MSTVIQLLVVLGIMVLVHEFGHFAVAKLCGIRVEIFSIGFGKRLFGIRRGDTDYRLSLLPLGGYVKMAGDNPGEAPTGDPGEFNAHPRWQRICVALAGPFANFILAFALMAGVSMLHNEVQEYISGAAHVDYVSPSSPAAAAGLRSGDLIVHFDNVENPTWDQVEIRSLLNINQTIPFSFVRDGQRTDTHITVESKGGPDTFSLDKLGIIPQMQFIPVKVLRLTPNMPAEKAGLKPGDEIVSIDGITLHSIPALVTYLQDAAGKPATLVVNRNGQQLTLNLTPEMADPGDGTRAYRIGFEAVQPPVKIERLPFNKAVASSWNTNMKYATLIVEVVKRMFTRQVSVRSLSGPIGIGTQIHEAIQMQGWMPIIGLMSYISINLGIFNLLPIPILDGGMILFLLIESVMRRDLNQQVKERVYQVAFVCLIVFAAMVIFNDITKLSFFSKVKP